MNIAANALPLCPGDKVLMIQGDHPNNAYAFLNLKKKGVVIEFIPMTKVMDAENFRPYLDEKTRAISMSQVTFHAGHRFDVESVGKLCAEKGLYFVVDVMQAIGVVPIDAKAMGATFIGSGTHKGLLVPQGLGLLYWNTALTDLEPAYMATISLAEPPSDFVARADNMTLAPTAGRFELGNFNLPAIQGLGASIDLINSIGIENIQRHCFDLGDYLIERLDQLDVGLVGPRERRTARRTSTLSLYRPITGSNISRKMVFASRLSETEFGCRSVCSIPRRHRPLYRSDQSPRRAGILGRLAKQPYRSWASPKVHQISSLFEERHP